MESTNNSRLNSSHVSDHSNTRKQDENSNVDSGSKEKMKPKEIDNSLAQKVSVPVMESDRLRKTFMIGMTMLVLVATSIALIKMAKLMSKDLKDMGA